MKLSARLLKNVSSANSFSYAETWTSIQDDTVAEATRLYFQFVDLDQGSADCPIRFLPIGTVVTATVSFPNLDDALEFTTNATQLYPTDDKSIWYIDLTSSQFPSSGAVVFSLTIDGVTRRFRLDNAMSVETLNAGMC